MRSVWIGKRQGNRTACSIKAKVFDDENPAIAELTIIDLSPTGARARLEKNVPLPEFFQISIPSRDETRYARLRWHRDVLVGFEFIRVSEVEILKDVTTLTRRLNLLEQSLAQRLNLAEGEGFYADEGNDPGPLGDKTLVPISVIHTTTTAAAPAIDASQSQAIESLEQRLERLEAEMTKALDLLHAEVAERISGNLAARFAAFENRNVEIIQTLHKLLPLINRAA
ncbi:MAG: PilZ domain-containing protein [Hyphomicrobiales bacterium]|nr:PilZ domain-containing protein [Hyphomicrobiales bacterium]